MRSGVWACDEAANDEEEEEEEEEDEEAANDCKRDARPAPMSCRGSLAKARL